MSQENRAAVFITTLTQLWIDERERQTARRRMQHRAQAERFMSGFRADIDDVMRPSEPSLPSKPARQDSMTRPVGDDTAAVSPMSGPPKLQE